MNIEEIENYEDGFIGDYEEIIPDNVVSIKESPKFRTVSNEELPGNKAEAIEDSKSFDIRKFAINDNDRAARKQQMLDDVYVMADMAIRGQITVIYAKPNTGKTLLTLWMLEKAVVSGAINGDDVIFVNADDTFKGTNEKSEIMNDSNIHVIEPGYKGFSCSDLTSYMLLHVDNGTAQGLVVVLDTIKKFTNIMDKTVSSAFMNNLRLFSAAGGSVILLAHPNKNRGADEKLVAGGTSDVLEDVDCVYMLDDGPADTPGRKLVTFTSVKSRGMIEPVVSFTYKDIGDVNSYHELYQSVSRVDIGNSDSAKKTMAMNQALIDNEEVILCAQEFLRLKEGRAKKEDVLKYVYDKRHLSKRAVLIAIDRHTGSKYHYGYRWENVGNDELLLLEYAQGW